MKTSDDKLKLIFRGLPYALALVGFFMFFYTLFGEKEPPIQSMYWFLLIIAAFFLPYIKEITFQDIKLKLEEGLEQQQEELAKTREELTETIQQEFFGSFEKIKVIDQEFGEIRNELIRGYQIYLKTLPEAEQYDKVIMLNEMYWKELNIEVRDLKSMLKQLSFYNGTMDNHYNKALMKALKDFQISQDMFPDGIFGHNSFKNLKKMLL